MLCVHTVDTWNICMSWYFSLIVLCWDLNEETCLWVGVLWELIWNVLEERGWYEYFFRKLFLNPNFQMSNIIHGWIFSELYWVINFSIQSSKISSNFLPFLFLNISFQHQRHKFFSIFFYWQSLEEVRTYMLVSNTSFPTSWSLFSLQT